MASVDSGAIEGKIDRLRSLDLEGLRREWRLLYHREPRRISRDLFVLGLGYKLQEIALGGLGKTTRRKLQTMAKALRTTGRIGPAPSLSLKPGARLVRDWGGRTHTVTVTEDGFEYGGENHPSLTKIAKKNHWRALVGTAFFRAGSGERRALGQRRARWVNRKRHSGGRPKRHAARFTAQPQEFAMIIAFRSAKVRSGVSLRPMSHGPHASRKGYLKLSLV
jgi:DUF2924 family protein